MTSHPPFPVGCLRTEPVVGEFVGRDRYLRFQIGPDVTQTLANLLLQDQHETVGAACGSHSAQREGDGEHTDLGECLRIALLHLVITHGVPQVRVAPDKEVYQRAQEMSLSGAVLCLDPKSLPLVMDGALEYLLEMSSQ